MMDVSELCRQLGKKAADYHRSFILPPKRQSSQKRTVKIDHSKPSPTPDVGGKTSIQPAQRYGTKMPSTSPAEDD